MIIKRNAKQIDSYFAFLSKKPSFGIIPFEFMQKKVLFQLNNLHNSAYYVCMTRSEFEHIAPQLRTQMLKVALNFFGSQDDAEDAVQEAMLQLWRYCEHIDTNRNVEALAVRVAKNCCVNLYRQQQRHTNSVDINTRTMRQVEGDDSPQQQLEAEDLQRMLSDVAALLKPRERQLFDMRAISGLSTEEIAAQTDIPKTSVAAMVSAARKKVFTELKRRMKQ